jgi:trehalose 6-phosphate synthase/phosphatase
MISTDAKQIEVVRDRILSSVAERAVLFLDYDGTLAPIQPTPELAILTHEEKHAIKELIDRHKPWLETVLVSGRESGFLEEELGELGIHIAAEHGAKHFDPLLGQWHRRIHRSRNSWYPTALKIISDYASHVPYSRIEKKQYAISWHYRQSPQEFADFQALKLAEELELGLANLPVSILRGKKVIEVRAIEADKGVFAGAFLDARAQRSVAFAIGDDRTDEDLFTALRGRGVSIKVGPGPSAADFAIATQAQVLPFLTRLLAALDAPMRERMNTPADARSHQAAAEPVPVADLTPHTRPTKKNRKANSTVRH